MMKQDEPNFEKAFEKLESILDQMNGQELSLDKSMKLYEEASALIVSCQSQLEHAEKKVEKLLKNRDQTLQVKENGEALTENFQPGNEKATPVL